LGADTVKGDFIGGRIFDKVKRLSNETVKHLEFIQGVITRMNTNSFQIKSWGITITAALLALYANSNNAKYLLVAIVPNLLFWFLDTYYLQQERKFRGVYNDVAGLTDVEKRIPVKLFEMPIHKYVNKKYDFFDVFDSKTILPFYLVQIILLLVGWFILSGIGEQLWQNVKCFIASITITT
jgi:hypothetical protein